MVNTDTDFASECRDVKFCLRRDRARCLRVSAKLLPTTNWGEADGTTMEVDRGLTGLKEGIGVQTGYNLDTNYTGEGVAK